MQLPSENRWPERDARLAAASQRAHALPVVFPSEAAAGWWRPGRARVNVDSRALPGGWGGVGERSRIGQGGAGVGSKDRDWLPKLPDGIVREAAMWDPYNPTEHLREILESLRESAEDGPIADMCTEWRARANCLSDRGYNMRDSGYRCLNSLWLLDADAEIWPEGESPVRGWPSPREYFQKVVDLYAALSKPAGCGKFKGFDWWNCTMLYDLWQPGDPGYQGCERKVQPIDPEGEYWRSMSDQHAGTWMKELAKTWTSCDCLDESFFGGTCYDGVRAVMCAPGEWCSCDCYVLCNDGTSALIPWHSCQYLATGEC